MSKTLIIVGVVLGIVAAGLINFRLQSVSDTQESAPFLRLEPDVSLAKGDTIRLAMLRTERLPEQFSQLTDLAIADTPQNRAWLTDRPVSEDVPAGGFLLYELFTDEPEQRFAATIKPNMRALTVGVNATSAVGYFVEPGSRVDVLGTMDVERIDMIEANGVSVPQRVRTTMTRTILQNIAVLAVGRATTRGAYVGDVAEDGYATVTFELTPEQAEQLVFAMNQVQGGLTLVLRNPADAELIELPSVSWEDLDDTGS